MEIKIIEEQGKKYLKIGNRVGRYWPDTKFLRRLSKKITGCDSDDNLGIFTVSKYSTILWVDICFSVTSIKHLYSEMKIFYFPPLVAGREKEGIYFRIQTVRMWRESILSSRGGY